jgi:hypothetical protein
MPYKLVASGDKYFVVSPHGHYLSKHSMSHDDALKQETAVRLTEIQQHAAPKTPKSAMDHVHTIKDTAESSKPHLDALGVPWTPAPRDAVHIHGIIKTSDIFAPLPLPVPRRK